MAYDSEYQTEDPGAVVLWLRTSKAAGWVDGQGEKARATRWQRLGFALPVLPDELEEVLQAAAVAGLTSRPIRPE